MTSSTACCNQWFQWNWLTLDWKYGEGSLLFSIHVVKRGSWNKRQVGNFLSWNEVGKFEPKLESSSRSWNTTFKTFLLRWVFSSHFCQPTFPTPYTFPTVVAVHFISSKNDAGEYFIWYAISLIILNINLL